MHVPLDKLGAIRLGFEGYRINWSSWMPAAGHEQAAFERRVEWHFLSNQNQPFDAGLRPLLRAIRLGFEGYRINWSSWMPAAGHEQA